MVYSLNPKFLNFLEDFFPSIFDFQWAVTSNFISKVLGFLVFLSCSLDL